MATSDSTTQLNLFNELDFRSLPDRAIKWNIDNHRVSVDLETGVIYGRFGRPLKPIPYGNGYRCVGFTLEHSRQVPVYIHRVLGYALWGDVVLADGMEIDHIDMNKSNNHPSNLRLATSSQNKTNSRTRSLTGFKGVTQEPRCGHWVAQITINGRNTHIGTYLTPEEAFAAYRQEAEKHYGEFARFE